MNQNAQLISEEKAWPKVAIIVLNWNGWQDTIECLESLKRVTYPGFHVVIIDNASTDGSVERIRSWVRENSLPFAEYRLNLRDELPVPISTEEPLRQGLRRVELMTSATNLGFCAGNNVGMEFADCAGADYFLILNNDTLVEPDFLQPLVEAAETSDDIGLVGGLICYAESPDTIWWAGGKFNRFLEYKGNYYQRSVELVKDHDLLHTDCITGCLTLVPRQVFETVGGYDEQLFIWSEDWDLSIRVHKMGYRMILVPSSRVYHKVSRSLGIMKPLPYYYGTRNRLLIKRKHVVQHLRILFFLWFIPTRFVRFSQFLIQGRIDLVHAGLCAIKDYFLGKTGKWDKQVE